MDLDISFKGNPINPPEFLRVPPVSVAQPTDQEMGSRKPTGRGGGPSLKVSDLFDPFLFLPDKSSAKGMGSGGDRRSLDSPPRIGFTPYPYSWAEPEKSESTGKSLESKWALLFDIAKKCKEAESEPSLFSWTRQNEKPAQTCDEVESVDPISSWKPPTENPDFVGAGLENLGNTCYLNVVLQCFIHTVPFVNGILSDTHSLLCDCETGVFCLLCSFSQVVEYSFASGNRPFSPIYLVDNLSYFSSYFLKGQQEDAYDFLLCFLNKLEECNLPSQSESFVKQLFGVHMVSKLKCFNCGHFSELHELSNSVSLGIGDAVNLVEALQSYTKVEKIEDSKATCDGCKEQVSREKQLALYQMSSIAIFHLKRFENMNQKIDKHVGFPLELDLLPFTVTGEANDVELKYELYAFIEHVGSTTSSGHYHCFIRSFPRTWFHFNDSSVVRVHEDFALSHKAYILFYAKEGTGWFSSFFETRKLFEDSITLGTPLRPASAVPSQNEDGGPRANEFESNERGVNSPRMAGSAFESDSPDVSLRDEGREKVHTSPEERWKDVAGGDHQNSNQTRPNSPSPEIPEEGQSDAAVTIPLDNPCPDDRASRKRKLKKDVDGSGAISSPEKNIPDSTIQQFLAALEGSKGEGYVPRKKSRKE